MKKTLLLMSIISSLALANVESIHIKDIFIPQDLKVSYSGKEAVFKKGFKIGVGSAITIKSVDENGELEFYALTDRGPNGDIPTT